MRGGLVANLRLESNITVFCCSLTYSLLLQFIDELSDDLEDEEDVFVAQPDPNKNAFGGEKNKAAYVNISSVFCICMFFSCVLELLLCFCFFLFRCFGST